MKINVTGVSYINYYIKLKNQWAGIACHRGAEHCQGPSLLLLAYLHTSKPSFIMMT